MHSISARLGWIVAGSYTIGLFVRRGYEAWWQVPPLARAPVLDLEYLVFGGLCVMASFGIFLVALRFGTLKTSEHTRTWWKNVGNEQSSAASRNLQMIIWGIIDLLSKVFPYLLCIQLFAAILTGGGSGQLRIVLFMVGMPASWLLILYLQEKGKLSVDESVVADHTAILTLTKPDEVGEFASH